MGRLLGMDRCLPLCVCLIAPLGAGACIGARTPAELADRLWGQGSNYEKNTRPSLATRTNFSEFAPKEKVSMQLKLFRARDVNMQLQVFEVEVFVRTFWYDPRLRYASTDEGGCLGNEDVPQGEVAFGQDQLDSIWTPGLYVPNVDGQQLLLSSAFWLYPDGLVWWTRRIILRLSCSMDLGKLPYDVQICPMRAETFRDTSALDIGFRSAGAAEKLISGGSLEWEVGEISGKRLQEADIGTAYGSSGVVWQFNLHRRPSYYEKYIISPCVLMVAIAWCSFFISRDAAPARVAMAIICFLAVSSMVSSVMSSLPSFGGEIWLLTFLSGSQMFIFVAVFQFGACSLLDRLSSVVEKVGEQHQNIEVEHEDDRIRIEDGAQETWNPDADPVPVQASADSNQHGLAQMSAIASDKVKQCRRVRTTIVAEAGIWSRFLLTSHGEMICTSSQLDAFFRFAYPVAYAVFLGVLFSEAQ